ncbi:DUF535 domain-containing protein [Erwinia sp. CPCC 100877]|nr:DUF535 domain-containing protein [Erwinia sp. CPCC 100877]
MSYIAVSSPKSDVPIHAWQLFLALSQGRYQPGPIWQKPGWRRKFILRSLAMPLATVRLLNGLTHLPQTETLLQAQPCLPCRLHRPWLMASGIRRSQALDAIFFHYQQMNQTLPRAAMRDYLSPQGWTLARLEGKNGIFYRLALSADCDLDKEGEATLALYDEQGIALAQLTFTLCRWDGITTLFIGGLQGAKARLGHSHIQKATRQCHGLFPKRLVLEAARQMALRLGGRQILAVSNHTHIYRSWRYRLSKRSVFLANYDAFWREMGGEPVQEGHFLLPLTTLRRPLAEIASKKRAEYRRRYALLDAMHAAVDESFAANNVVVA